MAVHAKRGAKEKRYGSHFASVSHRTRSGMGYSYRQTCIRQSSTHREACAQQNLLSHIGQVSALMGYCVFYVALYIGAHVHSQRLSRGETKGSAIGATELYS
jgi:hypothetical protein